MALGIPFIRYFESRINRSIISTFTKHITDNIIILNTIIVGAISQIGITIKIITVTIFFFFPYPSLRFLYLLFLIRFDISSFFPFSLFFFFIKRKGKIIASHFRTCLSFFILLYRHAISETRIDDEIHTFFFLFLFRLSSSFLLILKRRIYTYIYIHEY